jgi:hypothetical protein
MITRELEEQFRKLGGHAIKHLLCIHPDGDLIRETCKSVLGDIVSHKKDDESNKK